ncbi:hydroxyisourate hydrolase [Deinococcus hopiensis]|uniref:5-hydroxyisourate hydrolase n=1 Tax=Deinococcus hopiensis KR-140 TaxID=695939 RepID=A0A1W1UD95_9DEIO|nr:hydroxyisourate hydrolase [Deinococcus hopiensis]SMB79047.1 5-hydroxyisourate hydrolase [Deinococcus hopiensis KR-140]
MGAGLSTHVLDTARGRPAQGVPVTLFEIQNGERRPVTQALTNSDGRTDAPLIGRGQLRPGTFELTFEVAAYFEGLPGAPDVPFLDLVTLRFTVADPSSHYHVPLLISPWSYSTYRGS